MLKYSACIMGNGSCGVVDCVRLLSDHVKLTQLVCIWYALYHFTPINELGRQSLNCCVTFCAARKCRSILRFSPHIFLSPFGLLSHLARLISLSKIILPNKQVISTCLSENSSFHSESKILSLTAALPCCETISLFNRGELTQVD